MQTPSRLNAMIVASQIEAGASVSRDIAKVQVDYSMTLHEIRSRLEKEKPTVDSTDETTINSFIWFYLSKTISTMLLPKG